MIGAIPQRLLMRARVGLGLRAVDRAYRDRLGRPLDPEGRATWNAEIRRGRTPADIIAELEHSPEYRLSRTGFYDRLHEARGAWVRSLPFYDSILDIGGSSPTRPEGALIELGYPHRPTRLDIVDRPPAEQFHGRPEYEQLDQTFPWGRVTYHHGLAEGIGSLEMLGAETFDCVFMGQTIEHIEVDALGAVLTYIRTHLAPGGEFVFDTPNRAITRLVTGDDFISADHTHEYEPDEMAGVLEVHGFAILERVGILDLPGLAASHDFDPTESSGAAQVVDDPQSSFVFACRCVVSKDDVEDSASPGGRL